MENKEQPRQIWISVRDDLPKDTSAVNCVLVSDGKNVGTAYLSMHNEWIGPVWWKEISHWMPYPPAPKD